MAPVKPTILQIIPSLDTGGAELSTVEITSAIVAAGGHALVATEGGRLAHRILEAGGEIVPFPAASKNPLRLMANARALATLIRERQVDLIHARSRAPAWSALSAARATKRPFITTYHGAYAEKGPLKRAYNSVMARGDLVIANSRYTAALITSRYGTTADRLRVIHRGVAPAAFNRLSVSPERLEVLRSAWGIAEGQQVILHAARLTRWKGQEVLIQALGELTKKHAQSDWQAVFAGDDQGRSEYSAELKHQIAALGLTDRVKLVGHVDDMAAAFALASVSVIASTQPEAFGRTAIEAQMAGCPVIATNIGAPPETVLAVSSVQPGEQTGWLVPPGNAIELTQALHEALTLTTTERLALAARAQHHAATRFSLSAMQHATMGVYDELLGTSLQANSQRFADE
jgi:glycosyltransferase involved in cell wall biosynthesis